MIDNSSERIKAQYKNHIGSYDFVADRTEDGRKLKFLTSDNGPEFTARVVRQWLRDSEVGPLYIEPGTRWPPS